MKKKRAASTQVRIDPDLVVESNKLREEIGSRQSFSAFVNDMLSAGIDHTRHIRELVESAKSQSAK